jgi:glycerophosphoryl diester phosphodiesterase
MGMMTLRHTLRRSGLILFAALSGLTGCAANGTEAVRAPSAVVGETRIADLRARFLDSDGPVMVVAHRACWKETAENSIAAVRACRRLGVDMVELDVQRTADGQLILMHDQTVDRTTDGHGRVADLTLAQIKALRLRAGAGGPDAPLTEAAPPTFAEAMQAARGGVLVNVDAKGEVNLQAVRELERLGLVDHALFKSAAPPEDPALRQVLDGRDLLFMPILREVDGTSLVTTPDRYGRRLPAFEITFDTEDYFRLGAPGLRARGARVWVNTLAPRHAAGHVDADALIAPDAHWGRLIDLGANVIQTDEPGRLIDYLRANGRR